MIVLDLFPFSLLLQMDSVQIKRNISGCLKDRLHFFLPRDTLSRLSCSPSASASSFLSCIRFTQSQSDPNAFSDPEIDSANRLKFNGAAVTFVTFSARRPTLVLPVETVARHRVSLAACQTAALPILTLGFQTQILRAGGGLTFQSTRSIFDQRGEPFLPRGG